MQAISALAKKYDNGMKHLKSIVLTIILLTCTVAYAQVQMVNALWIDEVKLNKSDTVYVINFWATWCKPCVEELPNFEKLTATYGTKNLKVILVSCDFKKQIESRLIPFIKQKNITSKVVFMNESNPDNWIEKVDKRFSGAIPATLIMNGSKGFSYFTEGEMTYEELEKIVKPLIH
jgi:thiol-disulfide isomerase/thioredoxin